MNELNSYIEGLMKLVGYLAAFYGFVRLVLSDWNKKRQITQEARIKAETESHEPIIEKVEEVRDEILTEVKEIKEDVEILQSRQEEDRELNKLVAQLSLATADEMGELTPENGVRVKAAKAELREELLNRA